MKATLCLTKAGNGIKLNVENKWLYVSKKNLYKVLSGEKKSCIFQEIEIKEN